MTTTPTPDSKTDDCLVSELADAVLAEIDRLLSVLDGQVLVSQNRWVDHLLDLFNAVPNQDLRREITRTLDDIRLADSVRACELREALLLLAGAVAVESAFDPLLLAPAG